MSIGLVDNLGSASGMMQMARQAADQAAAGRFEDELHMRLSSADSKQERAREAARQLVASSLVMPLLKQAREDPLRADLFDGGQTEDIFGSQLDQELADRITARADFGLIDAIYQQTMGTAGTRSVDLHG